MQDTFKDLGDLFEEASGKKCWPSKAKAATASTRCAADPHSNKHVQRASGEQLPTGTRPQQATAAKMNRLLTANFTEKMSTEGAKHKAKAAEKDAVKQEKLQEVAEGGKNAEESKKDKKAKKKASKEKNGDGLKRPPSAYMLYNNYRRPVLRQENPSKYYPFNQFFCMFNQLICGAIELSLPDISRVIG